MSTAPTSRVWAISDMHWSTRDGMDKYGPLWHQHRERLAHNWRQRISHHDLVLVPGDLTFAQDSSTLNVDLAELHKLPGQKVFVPGNHDYWYTGRTQTKTAALLDPFPTIHRLTFAQPFYETGPHLIVGYKGSEPPDILRHDPKHFNKTIQHAQNVAAVCAHVRASYHNVIVTTHFAPSLQEREILSVLEPDLWLHGHSHVGGDDEHLTRAWELQRSNPPQKCISSDYLDQVPIEVTGGVLHPHV